MDAILVDDDEKAVKLLEQLIKTYYHELEIVGSSHTVTKAFDLYKKHQPDIVFLDIEMINETGFDLIDQIELLNPKKKTHFIFITGYEHYAIQAIKAGAFDYITKPIDIDELIEAIDKVKKVLTDNQASSNKFLIRSNGKNILLIKKDIIFITGNRNKCIVQLYSKKTEVSGTISDVETKLKSNRFYRLNRSTIINIDKVNAIYKGYVLLEGNYELKIPNNKIKEVKKYITKNRAEPF